MATRPVCRHTVRSGCRKTVSGRMSSSSQAVYPEEFSENPVFHQGKAHRKSGEGGEFPLADSTLRIKLRCTNQTGYPRIGSLIAGCEQIGQGLRGNSCFYFAKPPMPSD